MYKRATATVHTLKYYRNIYMYFLIFVSVCFQKFSELDIENNGYLTKEVRFVNFNVMTACIVFLVECFAS